MKSYKELHGMYVINAKAVKFAIDKTPTADVVPKSEVEKALLDVEVMGAELSRYTENIMQMREQDKRNIAREIFEEIEKEITAALKSNYKAKAERLAHHRVDMADEFVSYCEGKIAALRGIDDFIAELKKKYPEGK